MNERINAKTLLAEAKFHAQQRRTTFKETGQECGNTVDNADVKYQRLLQRRKSHAIFIAGEHIKQGLMRRQAGLSNILNEMCLVKS